MKEVLVPDSTPATPWEKLPREVADSIRPVLDGIVPDLIATIQQEVPEYARPMEGRFGEGVRRGVAVALERFVLLPGTAWPALTDSSRHVYLGLGRGEVRQGRSLESLLAAYRTGARVVFRALARQAAEDGRPVETVIALGESVFAYIDELSAASAEGYAREQSDLASDIDRRRAEVASLLLAGGADETTVHRLAAQSAWRLPDDVTVVVVPAAGADGLRAALGRECLTLTRATEAVAVVPGSWSRTDLAVPLAGRGATVGPVRSWANAPESLRLARSCPPSADGSPSFVTDHLLDVVLASEPGAVADLARERLAPLDDERPAARGRLLDTLAAWLAHQGSRTAVGEALGIHPQTVGYRVGRLRDLFGDDLDDPRTRFELELVLRARAARRPGPAFRQDR